MLDGNMTGNEYKTKVKWRQNSIKRLAGYIKRMKPAGRKNNKLMMASKILDEISKQLSFQRLWQMRLVRLLIS